MWKGLYFFLSVNKYCILTYLKGEKGCLLKKGTNPYRGI